MVKKKEKHRTLGYVINTSYFDLLPYDLIEYIRSFNHYWAASVIQKKFRECFNNKVREISRLYKFAFLKCKLPSNMWNFSILYKNKILKREDIFKTFRLCNCCTRHQINKPKIFQKWIDTKHNGTQFKYCECECRHLSRFLCREIE